MGRPKVVRKTYACAVVLKGQIFPLFKDITHLREPDPCAVHLKKAPLWRDAFTLSEQVVPSCHNTF